MTRIDPAQDKQREVLLQALHDTDVEVRRAASESLELLQACADISALEQALQSPERRARVAAVYTLERIHTPQAGTMLRELLEDQDPDVRAVAVQALGARQDTNALGALVRCLKDPCPAVAVHAARALAQFRDKRLVPYLSAMCSAQNSELVCACLEALGCIGDLRAVEVGTKAATHPDARVRLSAVRLLGNLH
jgi:HEAT repeat protein